MSDKKKSQMKHGHDLVQLFRIRLDELYVCVQNMQNKGIFWIKKISDSFKDCCSALAGNEVKQLLVSDINL